MPDYEALYHLLFNAVTDALTLIYKLDYLAAGDLLKAAQQKAEEYYLS